MKEVEDFPKWVPFRDRIINTDSAVERAIILAIESHNSDIFMAACFARHNVIPVFENNIGAIGFHEEPFRVERKEINFYNPLSSMNIDSCFDLDYAFRPQDIIFPTGALIATAAKNHYPELQLIIGMRNNSNRMMPYFSKQNILTEKLWEKETLKLERMEFMYKELNEEELYFKKLKGKFNPSGRSMKQHFNILQLNKQNKRGF